MGMRPFAEAFGSTNQSYNCSGIDSTEPDAATAGCLYTDDVDNGDGSTITGSSGPGGDLIYFSSLPAAAEPLLTTPLPATFNGAFGVNGNPGAVLFDYYQFEVTTAGTFTFQITAVGADLVATTPHIALANDDGTRTTDDVITTSSVTSPVSSVTLFLNPGSYLITAGQCCIANSEFVSGSNDSIPFYDPSDDFSYELTISTSDGGTGIITPP